MINGYLPNWPHSTELLWFDRSSSSSGTYHWIFAKIVTGMGAFLFLAWYTAVFVLQFCIAYPFNFAEDSAVIFSRFNLLSSTPSIEIQCDVSHCRVSPMMGNETSNILIVLGFCVLNRFYTKLRRPSGYKEC